MEYWQSREHQWPQLASMAFDFLAIPAMSSECERIHSDHLIDQDVSLTSTTYSGLEERCIGVVSTRPLQYLLDDLS